MKILYEMSHERKPWKAAFACYRLRKIINPAVGKGFNVVCCVIVFKFLK